MLELYDPFSFEIIRQLEAFGFCGEGEGGPFVADGHIAIGGSHPVTTDGGTMSFSHAGTNPQMMQRAIRAVQQLRGEAGALQVPDAHIALCSNGGAGALFTTLLILGDEPLMTPTPCGLRPAPCPMPAVRSAFRSGRDADRVSCAINVARRAACRISRRPSTAANAFRPNCDWRTSGGVGEIYSWTVVHRPVTAEFEPPYAPAIVTLDEGYQMLTNIVGVAPEDLAVGMPVQVQFHAVGSGRDAAVLHRTAVSPAAHQQRPAGDRLPRPGRAGGQRRATHRR